MNKDNISLNAFDIEIDFGCYTEDYDIYNENLHYEEELNNEETDIIFE